MVTEEEQHLQREGRQDVCAAGGSLILVNIARDKYPC